MVASVVGCTFDRTESYGVLSRPSYQWLEGGASRNVRFKDCTFIDCGVFYGVHRERPFFNDLVTFMTSGPVVVQVLEGEDAVARNRQIMGATNPANADAGTIRKELAESIEANSVHGSDSEENAATEIAFFFSQADLFPRAS